MKYLDDAIRMARAAGDIQLSYFRSANVKTDTKSNVFDIVTIADKESEKVIKSMIHDLYPEHGIISEESDPEHTEREWTWIIDPLDGTTNFSQGLPGFCTSIALAHFGEPVVGVVFAPYLNELFHAVKGKGAFRNGSPIKCSSKSALDSAMVASGYPYDRRENPDNNIAQADSVIPLVRGYRCMGSAAIDLCYVASGFYDAYWELNLKIWDIAAGRLIAEEAGAVTKDIRKDRGYAILTATSAIADILLEYIKK